MSGLTQSPMWFPNSAWGFFVHVTELASGRRLSRKIISPPRICPSRAILPVIFILCPRGSWGSAGRVHGCTAAFPHTVGRGGRRWPLKRVPRGQLALTNA